MKKLLRKWVPERTRAKFKSAIFVPPLMIRELLLPFSNKAGKGESLYFEVRRLIHRIEKNLVVPGRKAYSGYPTVRDIISLIQQDEELKYLDQGTRSWAVMVLVKFRKFVKDESAGKDKLAEQAMRPSQKLNTILESVTR